MTHNDNEPIADFNVVCNRYFPPTTSNESALKSFFSILKNYLSDNINVQTWKK